MDNRENNKKIIIFTTSKLKNYITYIKLKKLRDICVQIQKVSCCNKETYFCVIVPMYHFSNLNHVHLTLVS